MVEGQKPPSDYTAIDFLKTLFLLIQTARVYDDNNKLIKQSLAKFQELLLALTREGNLDIQIWRGRFYVEGEQLPYKRENISIINEMIDYFCARGIGGVRFYLTSRMASPEDLINFIRVLDATGAQEKPFDWLDQKLSGKVLVWVQFFKQSDDEQKSENLTTRKKPRERAKTAYSYALTTIKEVADKASEGIVGARKATRLAQTLVDLIQEDLSVVLGMTTIKEYDDYTYTHSVNVSLLATSLGRQIGLSRISLQNLCLRGLFHDLGKTEIPKKILLKEGKLTDEEREIIQNHSLMGVKKILRINASKEMRSQIILGPFEHHLNPDMTGYPKIHLTKKQSLLGKILRIADVYEALTANRVYRPRAFRPDEALRKMWSEIGKSFDPLLLKCFIFMMGIYPVGSIVELNDGRIGVVVEYQERSPRDLPVVRIIINDYEDGLIRGEKFSLADRKATDSPFPLEILRSLNPSELGVDVGRLLLEEK